MRYIRVYFKRYNTDFNITNYTIDDFINLMTQLECYDDYTGRYEYITK